MSLNTFIQEHKAVSAVVVIILLIAGYNLVQQNSSLSTATGGLIDFDGSAKSSGDVATNQAAYDVAEEAVGRGGAGYAPSVAIAPGIPVDDYYGSGEGIEIDEQRVIKNASIDMEVDSVEQAISGIENITKSLQGQVLSSSASEDTAGTKNGYITVKVPVDKFDEARVRIKEIGVFIKNEYINATDVTEEFIDIEAQLINLRAEEESYRTLLNRASRIEDILSITNSLNNVRTRIDRIEGRKRYLEGQTDLSTLTVSLSEDKGVTVPSREWRPITVIKDAARNTIRQFQGFVDNIIEFAFWSVGILPYLLLLAFIYWLVIRFKK